MANISREDDLKDLKERMENNGERKPRKDGRMMCISNEKANAYNSIHGTNFADDNCLDRYFQNIRNMG